MLDLDHLSRQTLGDRELEREVLELFAGQINDLIARLRSAEDRRERSDAVHTIIGSAAAIGAFDVVRVAERIGAVATPADGDVAELVEIAGRTRAFIIARLAC